MTFSSNPISRYILSIFLISVLASIGVYFGLNCQIYIWEFLIDLKVVLFAFSLWLFIRKYDLKFNIPDFGTFNWRYIPNIIAFFGPVVALTPTILAGYLLKKTTLEGADDPATFFLATLFDVPAVYFFSILVFLAEEMIFRGIIQAHVFKQERALRSLIITSLVWSICNVDKIAKLGYSSPFAITSGLLYIFSVGLVCSVLYWLTKSIWPGYSYRIGMLIFSSSLLSSDSIDSSGVFYTESQFLAKNGMLLSILSIAFTTCLYVFSTRQSELANSH